MKKKEEKDQIGDSMNHQKMKNKWGKTLNHNWHFGFKNVSYGSFYENIFQDAGSEKVTTWPARRLKSFQRTENFKFVSA